MYIKSTAPFIKLSMTAAAAIATASYTGAGAAQTSTFAILDPLSETSDKPSTTIIFGVLATIVALFGAAVAFLQLRYMRGQKALADIYELP